MTEKQQLLKDIQIVAFLVKDAQLFLDTHPTDETALSFFDYYNQLLAALTADYEAAFGPLTVSSVNAENGWSWINDPWPWEREAQ